jgi:hypothetical protein
MRKALTQKNTLLKNAQANAESIFFKRVFFSQAQEEIQIIFFPTLRFFNYLFFLHTMLNWSDKASIVDKFEQSICKLDTIHLRADRRASANSTYKKLAVQWLNEALCFVSSSVVPDSFRLRNRQLLVAANR